MALVRFVDSITAAPAVRLDLNSTTSGLLVAAAGIDLSPPNLRRAVVSTMLADGEQVTASAFANRVIKLPLTLATGTATTAATALQALHRELNRATNVLMVQLDGMAAPVFFETLRAPDYTFAMLRLLLSTSAAELEIPALPCGRGTKVTLPAVTVYNDPTEGVTLNANPFFETDASNWTVAGGTFVRSTAQFHEGVAAGLLTPSGVAVEALAATEEVPVAAGQAARFSTWVRCASTRVVNLAAAWYDASHVLISSGNLVTGPTVTANTWTRLDGTLTAPANTAYAKLQVYMSSTPPASDLLYVDEARLRVAGSSGGMWLDVTGVTGDVETPLYLSVSPAVVGRQTCIAVRRRGTPGNVPFSLAAESMTVSTDTTLQTNDPTMLGSGSNYVRTTFAGTATLSNRLTLSLWPGVDSVDLRGVYRVFARVRLSVATDTIAAQVRLLFNGTSYDGPLVTCAQTTQVRWMDMGLISYPSGTDPVTDGPTGVELPVRANATLIWRAQRSAGTGNLDTDHLLFVPADDRLALISWSAFSGPSEFIVDPDREMIYALTSGKVSGEGALSIVGGLPMASPGVTNRVWFTPLDGAPDDKFASVTITPYYWPRFLGPFVSAAP